MAARKRTSRRPRKTRSRKRRVGRPRKTSRSRRCPKGQILRDGYYRTSRKTGKRTYVKPGCIKDLGEPGKGPKLIGKLRKGTLTSYGYRSDKSVTARHAALRKAIRAESRNSVIRKLNAVAILSKNTNPRVSKIFRADQRWVSSSSAGIDSPRSRSRRRRKPRKTSRSRRRRVGRPRKTSRSRRVSKRRRKPRKTSRTRKRRVGRPRKTSRSRRVSKRRRKPRKTSRTRKRRVGRPRKTRSRRVSKRRRKPRKTSRTRRRRR